eukprot:TRINITY_DN1326_c0_g3_i1.p2 TRINITY_DN1326_c0_g3~~TRINITY_DN1326_c0_g3_i1.p2  ORF type:complete len:167 (-),score=47.37 TRINITY_DN1326_c0_g3_i1:94-594(-)
MIYKQFPKKSIVVLEDVDAVFTKRKKSDESYTKVTFSGLLNALDGVCSADGRIIFMTTNHLEKLSPALIRPGRIDRKILFDYASTYQIEHMFLNFYEPKEIEAEDNIIPILLEKLHGAKITTAQLQGWFIMHKEDPHMLLKEVEECLKENSRTDQPDDEVEINTDE